MMARERSELELMQIWKDNLEGRNAYEQEQWLSANAKSFSPNELRTIVFGGANLAVAAQVPEVAEVLGPNWLQEPADGQGEPVPASFTETESNLLDQARNLVAESMSGQGADQDLNSGGSTDKVETESIDKATREAAQQIADETGVPFEEALKQVQSKVEVATGGVLGGGLVPSSVLQVIGNRAPSGTELGQLFESWNRLNPDDKVSAGDVQGLYSKLSKVTPGVQDVIEAAFYGIDPKQEYTVVLADGRRVTVDASEFESFQSAYNLQSHEMSSLIRTAGKLGIEDHNGGVAFQMLVPLTVAARSQGADINLSAGQGAGKGYERFSDQYVPETASTASYVDKLNGLGMKFKEGKYIYGGNDFLAYVHALNPTLALKISVNPKDIKPEDVYAAQQVIIDGKFNQDQLAKMGYFATGLAEWQQEKGYDDSGSGSSGSGATRMIADQDALRQAAQDMYRAMFASEPSEAEVLKLMEAANGAVASAAPNQQVDVQAKIRAQLEQNELFKELYGKRIPGQTAEEYQAQFRQGAASMLGNEAADPSAVRSGMRDGDYQTTLGRVAASKQAWGNSTFLGRLAEAARLVSENT